MLRMAVRDVLGHLMLPKLTVRVEGEVTGPTVELTWVIITLI